MKHILSLGAGVQSTAVYLLAMDGSIKLDCAVFADTHAEPAPVYSHLEWLRGLGGPPIYIIDGGDLRAELYNTDGRNTSIPAFVRNEDGSIGRLFRHCTRDHKVAPILSWLRNYCGLRRKRVVEPVVKMYYGISLDEAARAHRIRVNMLRDYRWVEPVFPLIAMGWSRRDCIGFLRGRVPHEVPRSACTFCPYRDNHSWKWLMNHDPDGFADAVRLDAFLRSDASAMKRRVRGAMFLHRSCRPLAEANFDEREDGNQPLLPGMGNECEGMCGL